MRRHLAVCLTSMALAVGGFGFLAHSDARAEDKPDTTAVSTPAAATLPQGVKVDPEESKGDRDAILSTIASLTQAAMTPNGFDDVVERFVDQDRNRFGKHGASERRYDELNARVQGLRVLWKSKYNKDFKIEPADALTHVATVVGEIENPQAVASHWPVPVVPPAIQDEAIPAAAREPGKTDPENPDSNIERGRDLAIATLPKSRTLPAMNVSLVREALGWRVDVPNRLGSAKELHDSLLLHLNHLARTEAQWPVDEDAAALMFARHILLGVYGIEVQPKVQPEKVVHPLADERPAEQKQAGAKD